MEQVDTLINARWVLPIAPENTTLHHHSIAIRDGRIVDLLPTENAKKKYQAFKTLERPEHVLMPGLVNSHAHTPMNLFRGIADDLALMDWLQNHIWPAEQAVINAESVEDGSRLAIAEMIRGGTTCFNDHYFFPSHTAKVAAECGIRASIGLVIMSVPTDWAKTEEEYFKKATDVLNLGNHSNLITLTMAPHAPYTVNDNSLKQIKILADKHNLPIHMHVHETTYEIEQDMAQCGKRPLQRLHDIGLLSPRFIAVHMVHLTDNEIKLVKDTGTNVVHCPESNLKLASGFAPIDKLIKAGVNVAIGTDGAASNNDLDMFGELRTAAITAKAVAGDPTALPAEKALEMATLGGARALGLDKEIGSIEKGKAADVITVDLSSYLTQPVYHPMSQLAYAISRLQVADVFVKGDALLKDGKFKKMNLHTINKKAQAWKEKAIAVKASV